MHLAYFITYFSYVINYSVCHNLINCWRPSVWLGTKRLIKRIHCLTLYNYMTTSVSVQSWSLLLDVNVLLDILPAVHLLLFDDLWPPTVTCDVMSYTPPVLLSGGVLPIGCTSRDLEVLIGLWWLRPQCDMKWVPLGALWWGPLRCQCRSWW